MACQKGSADVTSVVTFIIVTREAGTHGRAPETPFHPLPGGQCWPSPLQTL